MPRFFFHISDRDGLIRDEEGIDLPDTNAAISEAEYSARDFAADCVRAGEVVDGRKIIVQDDHGNTLSEYAVKDMIARVGN